MIADASLYRTPLCQSGEEERDKRASGGDIFIVNSCINEGKVYLLEDPSAIAKSAGSGILSILFVGDVKQDASAEISMIYTVPHKRRQGSNIPTVAHARA
jgi:hypothetical protein